MVLNENALITWELAENMLHLLTEDQETVEFLINGASQQAERIAGRPLAYRTVDTYMPGSGTEMLFLPCFLSIRLRICVLIPPEFSGMTRLLLITTSILMQGLFIFLTLFSPAAGRLSRFSIRGI